jgi:DNA (cytosine-5)-methyltransferase 1
MMAYYQNSVRLKDLPMNQIAPARRPNSIEAFCGAGGMAIGLEEAGFDVRLALDIEPIAVATFNRNLKPVARVLDVTQVTGSQLRDLAGLRDDEVDLLSGGPPCQGFSKQRRGAWTLTDPRNSLTLHFARMVKEIQPLAFLFENVEIVGQKRGQSLIPNFFLIF